MSDQTQNPLPEAEKQDLHMAEAHQPDQNWGRAAPVQITPSKERLAAEHQHVTIKNTSPDQKHIVIDRFMVGHEFEPGQTRAGIDMLVSEVNFFMRERQPRKNQFGVPKPMHPIEIVDVQPPEPREALANEPPKSGDRQESGDGLSGDGSGGDGSRSRRKA